MTRRYSGKMFWNGVEADRRVETIILANGDQRLSIGPILWQGRKYFATLNRGAGERFRGNWQCDELANRAWCSFDPETGELTGQWYEDGRWYDWEGDLQEES
jgi:hypothetical protein